MGLCFASHLYLPPNNLYYDKLLLILIKKLEPNNQNLNKIKELKRKKNQFAIINLDYHFNLELDNLISKYKLTDINIKDLQIKKGLLYKDILYILYTKWNNYGYEIDEVYDFNTDKIVYYLTW